MIYKNDGLSGKSEIHDVIKNDNMAIMKDAGLIISFLL